MDHADFPRIGPASGNTARQLVMLAHGLGADGHDLIDLGHAWSHAAPDAVFVAPHAPFACDMAPTGRQWFSMADRSAPAIDTAIGAAGAALDGFIDAELARLALADYALMGFSQGAMTVLFAGLRRPAAPRAILAYSGALRGAGSLAAELANRAPVLLVHGEADEVVPVAGSREAEAALLALGVPVEALYCPGLGHGIDDAGISAGALFLQRSFA